MDQPCLHTTSSSAIAARTRTRSCRWSMLSAVPTVDSRCGWISERSATSPPITDEIRTGLAEPKALVAWYSPDYPKSRPCQMELTAALIAAQQASDPRRRVLVINPEPDARHIQPILLADEQHLPARDPEGECRAAPVRAKRPRPRRPPPPRVALRCRPSPAGCPAAAAGLQLAPSVHQLPSARRYLGVP